MSDPICAATHEGNVGKYASALLHRFNQEHGTTVLFVTHNPLLAARCDKTIQVIDGPITG